jgi:hypothetical protein
MNEFYIVLPSNSNPLRQPDNTANNYIVSWDNPVTLKDVSKWKVALTEISFNHSTWTTKFGHGIQVERIQVTHKPCPVKVVLSYEFMSASYGLYDVPKGVPNIDSSFFLAEKRLKLTSNKFFCLKFDNEINARLLGFHASKKQVLAVKDGGDGQYTITSDEIMPIGNEFKVVDVVIDIYDKYVDTIKQYTINESISCSVMPQFLKLIKPIFKQVIGEISMSESNIIQIQPHDIPEVGEKKIYPYERSYAKLKFLNGFHHVLGFKSSKPIQFNLKNAAPIIADFRPVLYQGITHMYVYTSVCSPIQVGHIQAPLLKTIWLKPSRRFALNEIKHIDFENAMYIPVSSNSFNSIEVNIRQDSGQFIPFNYGSVTSLTLHFKRDL